MIASSFEAFRYGKSVLIFDHIPKCAGTTMLECLRKAFPAFLPLYSAYDWFKVRKHLPAMLNEHGVAALAGHFSWGIHRVISKEVKCHYFTLLREPVSLVQSQLGYQQIMGSHACRGEAIDRWMLEHNFASMTSHISGGPLPPARAKIDSTYAFVGFTHQFDDALDTLTKATGIPLKQPVRRNVSTRQLRARSNVVDFVKKRGGFDFTLYEHALKRWGKKGNLKTPILDKTHSKENSTESRLIDQITNNAPQQIQTIFGAAGVEPIELKVLHNNFSVSVDDAVLLDTIARHKDLVIDTLNPALISSPEVICSLEKLAGELSNLASPGQYDGLNRKLADLYLLLANIAAKDNKDKSEQLFLRAIGLCCDRHRCKHTYMTWLRQQGRIRESLAILDDLADGGLDQHLLRESIVTLGMVDGGKDVPAFLKQHATEIRTAFPPDILQETIPYPIRRIRHLRGKKVLLIRSGPEILCRDLLNQLTDAVTELDIILQKSSPLAEAYDFNREFRVPDGKLDPIALLERKGVTLKAAGYDFILIVVSTVETLICAKNILYLAKEIHAATTCGYHFENIFYDAGDKYVFDVNMEL
ncbi:hypothetical protein [Desulfobacter vibrioformis]|uniref:hypothetical protein n=1 Tax=Desulfobacter vibrioformis TaxID=34031 RepID=UPI0005580874|nr:hypothetical protein [Desulfobacter vibrioformis]